jgi:hypothetical protein
MQTFKRHIVGFVLGSILIASAVGAAVAVTKYSALEILNYLSIGSTTLTSDGSNGLLIGGTAVQMQSGMAADVPANETDPLSPHKYTFWSDPIVTDDDSEGYEVNDLWTNGSSGATWVCTDNTTDAAVWTVINQAYSTNQIIQDDSYSRIIDNGTDPGEYQLSVDGTVVLKGTSGGMEMGPSSIFPPLADGGVSTDQLIVDIDGGETIAKLKVVYRDTTTGEWFKADANAAGKWPGFGLTTIATSDGQPAEVMRVGFAKDNTWTWTPGAELCLSETAGDIIDCTDASLYNVENDCGQWIGTAHSATEVFFDFTRMHLVRGAD